MRFLKTVSNTGAAYGGFMWPLEVGMIVEAPDWNTEAECGGGLHGLRNGNGDANQLDWNEDVAWIAFESVDQDGNPSDEDCVAIDSGTKWKCRRAIVRAVGRAEATKYLQSHGCTAVHGGTATAGDDSVSTAGHGGTAVVGHRGKAIVGNTGQAKAGDVGIAVAGNNGKATAGDYGTAMTGHCGTAVVGHGGTAVAGHDGNALAGNGGNALAGNGGNATAGYGGMAKAGHRGTATVGERGTATVGDKGVAMAGRDGVLMIASFSGQQDEIRVARVGEKGIKANTPYRLDDDCNFVEA